ncbi:unnamed protein product [Calypogeia fissa]
MGAEGWGCNWECAAGSMGGYLPGSLAAGAGAAGIVVHLCWAMIYSRGSGSRLFPPPYIFGFGKRLGSALC